MNVVCFGQCNWDVCWTRQRHLISRLAERGHRVLYVDPLCVDPDPDPDRAVLKRSGLAALRALAPLSFGLATHERVPRLWVHTPTQSPLLPSRLEQRRRRWILRRLVARLRLTDPVVLTMSPQVRPMAFAIAAPARLHFVYDEMMAFGGTDAERRQAIRHAGESCTGALARPDIGEVCGCLAAGRPIVSTFEGSSALDGAIALTGAADAFDAALAKPHDGAALGASAIAENGWERRVDDLERDLEHAQRLARRRRVGAPSREPAPFSEARARATRSARRAYRPAARPGGAG